jgi:uncharacterized membrane protein YfcA
MNISLGALDYLIVLPLVFLAGIVDSIAGGGGLITLPAYWIVGIPPAVALGTNKFASFSGTTFTTARFLKAGLLDVPVALTGAALGLVGSWIGTQTALKVSASFFNILLLVLIPIVAVIILATPRTGAINRAMEIKLSKRLVLGSLAGLVIGFYDGFFGPGTGTFLILIYTLTLKYDFVTANANAKLVNLASNFAALMGFIIAGKVLYAIAIPAAVCGIAGNLLGSSLVLKKGNRLIRIIFILVLILLMLKILTDII